MICRKNTPASMIMKPKEKGDLVILDFSFAKDLEVCNTSFLFLAVMIIVNILAAVIVSHLNFEY